MSSGIATPTLCCLCGAEPPIRNSHVIPEFLHSAIYDTKNRALKMTASTGKSTPVQVGFRAPILGKNCEALVNDEYEQPFRRMWFEEGRAPTGTFGGSVHQIYVPDYRRFKLFLLSVLFRAGVCTLDPYASVNLGTHENSLREMLLHGDARSPMDYPILGSVLLMPNSRQVYTSVTPPFEVEFEGHPLYVFAFGGCLWEFLLTTNGVSNRDALADDGMMRFKPIDLWTVTPLRHGYETNFKNAQVLKGRKRK